MRARLVDWSLLCLVLFEAASGFYTFTQGRPENIWFFTLHGAAGLALVLLLFWKLRRVWVRIVDRRRWDAGTPAALAALGFVLLTLGSGLVWTLWHWPLGYPNGLNWHVVFGVALVLFTVLHMLRRFKPLRRADLRGANLRGARLRGADLRLARLDGADLQGADLLGTLLPHDYRQPLLEDAGP